jgi:hypothetical protein
VVGDGTWLSIGEATERLAHLGYDEQKVRRLADSGKIRTMRPPAAGPGRSHRRLFAEDVEKVRAEIEAQINQPNSPPDQQPGSD